MKKLILAMTVAGLTVAIYAADTACPNHPSACAGKDKTCCAQKTAANCPANKGKCPATGGSEKSNGNNKPVQSPKATDASKS